MNKELINKYKHEFDHWLNGGKLLCYTEVEGSYYEVTDEKWDFVCDIGFIINDEFVEFRKALVEGKTIEYLGQSSNLWQELEDANFNLHQTCYRIKPDEPKFKVGDFVIHNGDIKQVTKVINGLIDCLDNSIALIYKEDTLELWTPVKGEWCWFYDSKTKKYSHLSQFNSINNGYFKSMSINYYNFCEPFLNSLPSYLKDK